MFCSKLDAILTALNCTITDIADFTGCDPSNISRIHSGKRVPSPDSHSLARLVNGIYGYAESSDSLETLCKLCGIGENETEESIKRLLSRFFYNGQSMKEVTPPVRNPEKYKKKKFDCEALFFGERLSCAMDILELSNVRLSRQLNVDASHISRFRNGLRTPKSNKHLLDSLSTALFNRTIELQKVCELSQYMNVEQSVFSDRDRAVSMISIWLVGQPNSKYISAVDRLLESLDNICSSKDNAVPSLINHAQDTGNKHQRLYWNTDGLRKAVIRFLISVADKKSDEVYLYSDQNMNWLTQDPGFFPKWRSLMEQCVKNGTRIKIIHNIDRDIEEMIDAIRSWLPLYMSGMIEPYYCNRKPDTRFTHTLFICPGSEAVFASNVTGTEEFGRYEYCTDSKTLSLLTKEFTHLLSNCDLLLKIYTGSFLKKLLLQARAGSGDLCFYCACEENCGALKEIREFTQENKSCQIFSVSNAPYSDICVILGEQISAVIKLSNPQAAFVFKSPMMHQAFEEYLGALDSCDYTQQH